MREQTGVGAAKAIRSPRGPIPQKLTHIDGKIGKHSLKNLLCLAIPRGSRWSVHPASKEAGGKLRSIRRQRSALPLRMVELNGFFRLQSNGQGDGAQHEHLARLNYARESAHPVCAKDFQGFKLRP